MKKGKVILVGAGPGDPGLLTLRGAEALKQAEVVVYDRLVSADILGLIPPEAERIDVGKTAGCHPVKQPEINRILLKKALAGKRVVRLKGGDPFVFGRGGEELELLCENQVPFEVVSGVTSAVAAFAYAGIPVTHRGIASSFHVITGHLREGRALQLDYEALVRLKGTLIFLMGLGALPQLMAGLLQAGMPPSTPAAVVESGTLPTQRKVLATVETLAERVLAEKICSPAVIAVGEVCSLSEKLDWFSGRPLAGKRILVCRSRSSPGRLAPLLAAQGAAVLDLPVIETRPLAENPALWELLSSLDCPGWLLFSSARAAEIFLDSLLSAQKDLRALAGWKIGAVGNATARALRKAGLLADLAPDSFGGRQLGEALVPLVGKGERVVSLESSRSAGEAARVLAEAGACVQRLALYETSLLDIPDREQLLKEITAGEISLTAFSSASMAEGLAQGLGCGDFNGAPALCIGEQTAAAARRLGFCCRTAAEASVEAMAEGVLTFYKSQSERNGS